MHRITVVWGDGMLFDVGRRRRQLRGSRVIDARMGATDMSSEAGSDILWVVGFETRRVSVQADVNVGQRNLGSDYMWGLTCHTTFSTLNSGTVSRQHSPLDSHKRPHSNGRVDLLALALQMSNGIGLSPANIRVSYPNPNLIHFFQILSTSTLLTDVICCFSFTSYRVIDLVPALLSFSLTLPVVVIPFHDYMTSFEQEPSSPKINRPKLEKGQYSGKPPVGPAPQCFDASAAKHHHRPFNVQAIRPITPQNHALQTHRHRRHSLFHEPTSLSADKGLGPLRQLFNPLGQESTPTKVESNPLEDECNTLEADSKLLEHEAIPLEEAHGYKDPNYSRAEGRLSRHRVSLSDWDEFCRVQKARSELRLENEKALSTSNSSQRSRKGTSSWKAAYAMTSLFLVWHDCQLWSVIDSGMSPIYGSSSYMEGTQGAVELENNDKILCNLSNLEFIRCRTLHRINEKGNGKGDRAAVALPASWCFHFIFLVTSNSSDCGLQ
jgi:hypothetical protein